MQLLSKVRNNILRYVIYHLHSSPWQPAKRSTLKERTSEWERERERMMEDWMIREAPSSTSQYFLTTTLPIHEIKMSSCAFPLLRRLARLQLMLHNGSQYYGETSCVGPLWSPLAWGSLIDKFSWWLAGGHLRIQLLSFCYLTLCQLSLPSLFPVSLVAMDASPYLSDISVNICPITTPREECELSKENLETSQPVALLLLSPSSLSSFYHVIFGSDLYLSC